MCQLTQHMMNIRDPTKKEPKQISIFVGTWNMGKTCFSLITSVASLLIRFLKKAVCAYHTH